MNFIFYEIKLQRVFLCKVYNSFLPLRKGPSPGLKLPKTVYIKYSIFDLHSAHFYDRILWNKYVWNYALLQHIF